MRRSLPPVLILALLAGAAQAAPDAGTMQRSDTMRDAVTAPLEDLNLKRQDIPPVLLRAVENPYDLEGLERCEPIAGEIGRLDGRPRPRPRRGPAARHARQGQEGRRRRLEGRGV